MDAPGRFFDERRREVNQVQYQNYRQRSGLVLTTEDPSAKVRVKRNINTLEKMGFRVTVLSPFQCRVGQAECVEIFDRQLSRTLMSRGSPKEIILALYLQAVMVLGTVFPKIAIRLFSHSRVGVIGERRSITEKFFDLVLVEEVELLPSAVRMRSQKRAGAIIMDLRDFYWKNEAHRLWGGWSIPSVFRRVRHKIKHAFRKKLYRHSLKECDAILVVGDGHASLLESTLGLKSVVIKSASEFNAKCEPTRVDPENIELVYHGAGWRQRGIDILIGAVNETSANVSLHLYLALADTEYLRELKGMSNHRVHFHDPVEYHTLVEVTNKYDIGVAFFPPFNTTLEYCLPNKFFEYIQSRLAIISGPTVDMAREIENSDIGYVTDGFAQADLVKVLDSLDWKDVRNKKELTDRAAARLSFEAEEKKLIDVFERVAG